MTPQELQIQHSAFRRDDTLVSILPSWDASTASLPLLSTVTEPFHAGMPLQVPLWMAALLYDRQLCTLQPPDWMNVETFQAVLEYERTHDDLSTTLPADFEGITLRCLPMVDNAQVLRLLLQDVTAIRLDKLRQAVVPQIQQTHVISIDGMATHELDTFRPLLTQACRDRQRMMETPKLEKPTSSTTSSNGPRKAAAPLRRFR